MTELHHIERAPTTNKRNDSTGMAHAIESMRESKDRAIRSFINNRGFFIAVILMLIVILVFTTSVNFSSSAEIGKFSVVIFMLMFCSYSMYMNGVDSGTRAGKLTSIYIDAQTEYEKLKKHIIDGKKVMKLGGFCRWYVEEELKNTRKDILDNVGVTYEEYEAKWEGADKETILAQENMSERVKYALIKTNEIKPIKLVPEMIIKSERSAKRRSPLGAIPQNRKRMHHGIKLVTTVLTSIFTCMLALDVLSNPSWATFAELFIKLLMVVLNGFMGYKMGYENITVDTVNYVSDQTNLLHQFLQYLEETKDTAVAVEANNG